jgi:DNA-binding GntR family transcriptional regulator
LLDAIRLRDTLEAAVRMREHLTRLEAQLQFNPPSESAPDLNALFGAAA